MPNKNTGLAFHLHHAEKLVEWCEDYEGRVAYIKEYKLPEEHELRLRLFKLIPEDRLPARLLSAGEGIVKALEAYDKALEAYNKKWESRDRIWPLLDKEWAARW